MRIHPGIIPREPQPPIALPYESIYSNPYHVWYTTLAVGAGFACLAFALEGLWDFTWLAARVRRFPPQNLLRGVYPFIELSTAGALWVATWLLTTEDPSPHKSRRLRASLLRLLASVLFIGLASLVLGFFGEVSSVTSKVLLGFQVADVFLVILLWLHLRWIAQRLQMGRGVQWRMVIAMLGYVATTCAMQIWPMFWRDVMEIPYRPSRDFVNMRLAMLVLWETIGALVMLRAALGFHTQIKRSD